MMRITRTHADRRSDIMRGGSIDYATHMPNDARDGGAMSPPSCRASITHAAPQRHFASLRRRGSIQHRPDGHANLLRAGRERKQNARCLGMQVEFDKLAYAGHRSKPLAKIPISRHANTRQ